jgi:hypothetical protein
VFSGITDGCEEDGHPHAEFGSCRASRPSVGTGGARVAKISASTDGGTQQQITSAHARTRTHDAVRVSEGGAAARIGLSEAAEYSGVGGGAPCGEAVTGRRTPLI